MGDAARTSSAEECVHFDIGGQQSVCCLFWGMGGDVKVRTGLRGCYCQKHQVAVPADLSFIFHDDVLKNLAETRDAGIIEVLDFQANEQTVNRLKGDTIMPRGHDRREERRDDRGPGQGSGKNKYQMREKMVSIGDDFWIENEQGQKAFKVDGKALRVRNTLNFDDAHGNTIYKIQEKMVRVKDSMEVEDAQGKRVAMVKKAIISPVRDRFSVSIKGGPDLDVQGNILDHEYKIGEGRNQIAEVSKKWFRIRDSYGVEIEQGQDDLLVLAVTVCIDQMAH